MSGEHDCLYCYKELVQREDESDTDFKKRQYCNKRCSGLRSGDLRKKPAAKPKRVKFAADRQFSIDK